ncbi:DDE family transposase [Paraburkholderia sp. BL6669N2]|nr:DDE family transposase [Paraburkholderia sp. BL6669N2]
MVRVQLAGDGSSRGKKRVSGNTSTKRCWPNCVAVAKSISRVRSSTAHRFAPCWREKKTGPNPTDRRKLGSKHRPIVDAQGIPLAVILSAANRHDITQLDALVDAIPHIRGKRGRPLHKPQIVQGDRGYSSEPHRRRLRERGITPVLAKIGSPHGSGLGKTRWLVERSIAWLHSFRRLKIRYERYAHVHEAFLSLACALICWTRLKPLFN